MNDILPFQMSCRISIGYLEEIRRLFNSLIRQLNLWFTLLLTTTPTTTPTMMRTMRQMKKHIQRFLRAARAETTAFSVYPRLEEWVKALTDDENHKLAYPASVSCAIVLASVSIALMVSSCCSTSTLICNKRLERRLDMFQKWQTSLKSCASSPRVFSIRFISSCRSWTSR